MRPMGPKVFAGFMGVGLMCQVLFFIALGGAFKDELRAAHDLLALVTRSHAEFDTRQTQQAVTLIDHLRKIETIRAREQQAMQHAFRAMIPEYDYQLLVEKRLAELEREVGSMHIDLEH